MFVLEPSICLSAKSDFCDGTLAVANLQCKLYLIIIEQHVPSVRNYGMYLHCIADGMLTICMCPYAGHGFLPLRLDTHSPTLASATLISEITLDSI